MLSSTTRHANVAAPSWTHRAATVAIPDVARDGRLHCGAERGNHHMAIWVASDGAVRCAAGRSGRWEAESILAPASEQAVRPRVALDRDGRAAACWIDWSSRVCLRTFDGKEWWPIVHLSPSGSGSAGARLAIDSQQNVIVTWNDHRAAVHAVEVDREGTATGWAFDAARGPAGYFPAIGAGGGAVVSYLGMDGAIWVISRESRGRWSDPRPLTDSTVAAFPSVAVDDSGQALVTWIEGRDRIVLAGGFAGGAWGPAEVVANSDRLPWVNWSPVTGFSLHFGAPEAVVA